MAKSGEKEYRICAEVPPRERADLTGLTAMGATIGELRVNVALIAAELKAVRDENTRLRALVETQQVTGCAPGPQVGDAA